MSTYDSLRFEHLKLTKEDILLDIEIGQATQQIEHNTNKRTEVLSYEIMAALFKAGVSIEDSTQLVVDLVDKVNSLVEN